MPIRIDTIHITDIIDSESEHNRLLTSIKLLKDGKENVKKQAGSSNPAGNRYLHDVVAIHVFYKSMLFYS